MKFRQRVVATIGLVLVSLIIYLMLPSRQNEQARLLNLHQRGLEGYRLSILQDQSTKNDQEMCRLTGEGPPHYAHLSTHELFAATKFDSRSNGEWEMPQPERMKASGNSEGLRPPHLTVIIVPHSHNDPGWQKTVDEYYADQTKHILDNMVNKLNQYPNMTFVWAETVFFSMWWNELDDIIKFHVRRMMHRGQLEFVLGGWVMPDEATTHYTSVIDQLVEGHQWLWDNLGTRPENAWCIDPFGLSGTMPYLWRLAGMRHMVIQRVHQAVKASLSEQQALEFYWRQMWDSSDWSSGAIDQVTGVRKGRDLFGLSNRKKTDGGDVASEGLKSEKDEIPRNVVAGGSASTDILCHVMPYMLYSIKYTCGPNPHICKRFDFGRDPNDPHRRGTVNSIKDIPSSAVAQEAELLAQQYRLKASHYRYNVLLVPLGDDFRYDKEDEWDQTYSNYEKLMHYMNDKSDLNLSVRWGTLKDYFRAVELEEKKQVTNKLPVLSGDFFPYSDKDRAYWTGYYTTRPFDKYFGRDVQAVLHAADKLNTFSYAFYKKWGLKKEADTRFFRMASMLQQAHRSMGIFQHHDAVTGTAKDFVVQDYEEILLTAYTHSQDVIRHSIQVLLSEGRVESPSVFHPVVVRADHQTLPKRQVLHISPGRSTTVALYNPLGQLRCELVSLLVDSPAVRIVSSLARETLLSQVSPVWSSTQKGAKLEENAFELSFYLTMPPFSLVTVVLTGLPGNIPSGGGSHFAEISTYNEKNFITPPSMPFSQKPPHLNWHNTVYVSNGLVELALDPQTGSLLWLTHIKSSHKTRLNTSFQYYKSKGSGAYIFSPAGKASPLFPSTQKESENDAKSLYSSIPTIKVSEGDFATFIDIAFQEIIAQRLTLYSQPSHLAGAIFVENTLSIQMLNDKEVIFRFDTDITNNDLSYFTDQNGFQFIRRQNHPHLPTEANYYPMTSGIILQDDQSRLTLLSGQPHGCSSLQQGQLEVMLDRQLVEDDFRGLGEGVHDIKTTVSRFVILTETRLREHEVHPSSTPLSASLSLSALALQDVLNEPVLAYYSTVDSDIFFRSLAPISPSALPCDVATVSLQSLATNSLRYNGTSLIMHRRGYDCTLQPPTLPGPASFCVPSDPELTLNSLFGGFSISNSSEMTLTSTTVKRRVRSKDKLALKPMQLSTLHFYF